MSLLKKVETLCESQGISINRLEQVLGFSQGSIRKMDKSSPKADRLYKIAQYFQVPMEYFFNESDPFAEAFLEATFPFRETTNEKPLYRASAGQGCYNAERPTESISIEEDGYEYVEIVGNSMSPILEDGDIVTVELTTEVSPHDLAVVKIDGETACVKYCEITDHGIWLKAENKSVYEDRFYSISQVLTLPITVLGRVIELRRKIQ